MAARKPAASAQIISIERKTAPIQDRSRATFTLIIREAGELLDERGIDAFNVNALVQRTGLTPPAIYRYFPNKYAILKELGERLMAAQDEIALAHMQRWQGAQFSETALIEETQGLMREIVRVTAEFPGSVAVLRAMRAVPMLREVRLASAEMVASHRIEVLRAAFPHAAPERLKTISWLLAEIGNSVIELLVESRKDGRASEPLLRECAIMLARLQTSLA